MSKTVTLDPGESVEVVFTYTPPEAGVFQVRVGDELEGQFEVIGVAEGVVLHGFVTHLGVPIAGAKVQLNSRTDYTIDGGAYHFSHVIPGRYNLSVNAEGYEPYSQEIDVLDQEYNRFDIELAVTGGGALYGTVTDKETGAGIEGIRVDTDGIITHTGANGCYSYASLGPGTYYMDFTDPQGRYYMTEVDGVSIGDGDKEVNVQMVPTGIIPTDLTPFRGKFTSPWNGERFDTIEELIDNGGCPWSGVYTYEGWSKYRSFCPYCRQEFTYSWDESTRPEGLREAATAIILEHINNTHRLICTATGEDFTWSAKAEDRYDFFASECSQVYDPIEVEIVPLAPFKTTHVDWRKELAYVETYREFFEQSDWRTHGEPSTPSEIKDIAQSYPYLYQATQIVDGPMFARLGDYEGGEEGVNMKYCGKWGNYNYDHPGCTPTGIKIIIPALGDKSWKCHIDDSNQWTTIATFEGSGAIIKWPGIILDHYGKIINVRIEYDDKVLVILHPYIYGGANLPHDLATLYRHYRMDSDQLDNCKDCLLNTYNRLHGVTGPYVVSDKTQAVVKEGGQAVLDRDDCRVSSTYYGYPRFEHTYRCNWTPSEVNSKYNQKKPVLDQEYADNVAEVERLIAMFEMNWS